MNQSQETNKQLKRTSHYRIKRDTHSSEGNDLPRALGTNVLRNSIKVENELWKRLSIMSLPLPNGINRLRRWPFRFRSFELSLPFPIPCSYQLFLEGTWLCVGRTPCEEFGIGGARFNPGWGTRILLQSIDHLLLGRRLAVGYIDRSIRCPRTLCRDKTRPVRGIGSIRHVGERSAG
jgi:hypothetical protein